MYILITSIILGIIFTSVLFGLTRFFNKKKGGAGTGSQIKESQDKIQQLDQSIESGLTYSEQMIPLEKLKLREQEIAELANQLSREREKLEKLDKQVESLQDTVETEETAHNELKKGKEEAAELAEEIRQNKNRLESEYEQLESELNKSLTEINTLSGEVELTAEQQAACDRVHSTLQNSILQLKTLSEIYSQASTRFSNLENQYLELEAEFTKLVEKELGGFG
jgi:chromosome segregation ATPase